MGRPRGFASDMPPTAAERAAALAAADERLAAVREQISHAALRCLRQQNDAADQVRAALELVDQARGYLAKITTSDPA